MENAVTTVDLTPATQADLWAQFDALAAEGEEVTTVDLSQKAQEDLWAAFEAL
jgi:hypothetical protein